MLVLEPKEKKTEAVACFYKKEYSDSAFYISWPRDEYVYSVYKSLQWRLREREGQFCVALPRFKKLWKGVAETMLFFLDHGIAVRSDTFFRPVLKKVQVGEVTLDSGRWLYMESGKVAMTFPIKDAEEGTFNNFIHMLRGKKVRKAEYHFEPSFLPELVHFGEEHGFKFSKELESVDVLKEVVKVEVKKSSIKRENISTDDLWEDD